MNDCGVTVTQKLGCSKMGTNEKHSSVCWIWMKSLNTIKILFDYSKNFKRLHHGSQFCTFRRARNILFKNGPSYRSKDPKISRAKRLWMGSWNNSFLKKLICCILGNCKKHLTQQTNVSEPQTRQRQDQWQYYSSKLEFLYMWHITNSEILV